ncbi:MAG: SufS family cysteine desulfurase [Gammaproteobacteria bacterium]
MNTMTFDIQAVRKDFPILHQEINGHSLVYFDNAATTQKPKQVIDVVDHFYLHDYSNVHRGVHALSQRATEAYENAREKVAHLINANTPEEIIFTRGTTEAINLVAQSYARAFLKKGDEIIISELEHHSNIVPWQLLCKQIGTVLKVAPINDEGEIILSEYFNLFTENTKLVSISHISNALGTINPIKKMILFAKEKGAKVLIDGAQAIAHTKVDVQTLDCDFYAFSGHKMYGPTGIGVLYGKKELLEIMPPYQGGGEMIKYVSFENTMYSDPPYKFEAGTPNIAGAVGMGAAIDYMKHIGLINIIRQEQQLIRYATEKAKQNPQIKIIGTAKHKSAILSFTFDQIHAHDVGTILDHYGIAVRAGHHCAMPIMQHFRVPATVRASFAFYNTFEEIDRLFENLQHVSEVFS